MAERLFANETVEDRRARIQTADLIDTARGLVDTVWLAAPEAVQNEYVDALQATCAAATDVLKKAAALITNRDERSA
jgi:hypothetical protein